MHILTAVTEGPLTLVSYSKISDDFFVGLLSKCGVGMYMRNLYTIRKISFSRLCALAASRRR